MDLKEACDRTGLSERTLRRFIKDGKLTAIMVDHHWEIIPESLEGLVRKNSGQENGHMPENDRTASGQAECPNCEWMRQHLEDQLMEKDRQLSEKDKQIEQLHILLQNCQEQVQRMLPAPREGRWWWPWK